MRNVVLIASERREFSGLERALGNAEKLNWGLRYSARASARGIRFTMAADGAGRINARRSAERALHETESDILVSTGFCGALDESLKTGDVVVASHVQEEGLPPVEGGICVLGVDRVIATAAEKKRLRDATGAAIVDMESHELARIASARGLPFLAVRAVSDTANSDLPVDFNLARDKHGRISDWSAAMLAFRNPLSRVPGLIRLARASHRASQSLGEFLAAFRFER